MQNMVALSRARRHTVRIAVGVAGLVLVALYPAVMSAVLGTEFFPALGVEWRPVHGFGVPGALVLVQLVVSVLVPLYYRLRVELAMLLILAASAVLLGAAAAFPGWVPPLTNATDPWIAAAVSHAAWIAAYRGRRDRSVWYSTGLFALTTALAMRIWAIDAASFGNGVMLVVAPALLGLFLGYRNRWIDAWRDRAERADREQALLAEQARADERVKLAGEMHDVVTHRLSLMVLQAGALGVTADDEPTRAAAEELRSAGCEALDELRALIGVLRNPAEEESGEEAVGARSPAELVEESRAVGLPVRLSEHGSPAQLSPVVTRTAYQVVREGLTNVHKHAPGSDVEVAVDYGHDRVHVRVSNAAPPNTAYPGAGHLRTGDAGARADALRATGSGTGLEGLRRRVELVHGELRAEPGPGGGFVLDATLPAYVPTADRVKEGAR